MACKLMPENTLHCFCPPLSSCLTSVSRTVNIQRKDYHHWLPHLCWGKRHIPSASDTGRQGIYAALPHEPLAHGRHSGAVRRAQACAGHGPAAPPCRHVASAWVLGSSLLLGIGAELVSSLGVAGAAPLAADALPALARLVGLRIIHVAGECNSPRGEDVNCLRGQV